MRYFKLIMDDKKTTDFDMVCYAEQGYEVKFGISKYDLCSGTKIKDWPENFYFDYDSDYGSFPTDFLVNNLDWIIISTKFRSLIEEFVSEDAQFLPVKLRDKKTGKIVEGYSVLNVTTVVDALDEINSRSFTIGGKIGKETVVIARFALFENRVKGKHIFRILRSPFSLFVSEDIKLRVFEHGLTGCYFIPIILT